jgi:lipopolysaccharide biosynthesis regulator YciM
VTLWIILILCVVAVIFHRVWVSVSAKRRRSAGRRPYVEGISSLLDGDYDAALSHFKQAIREEPQEIDPYIRLGDVLREKGDLTKAIQIHRELTVRPSASKGTMARIQLALARDYVKGDRLDRAAATYEQVLGIQPQHEKAMNELLELYERMGEWDKAYLIRRDISKMKKVDDTRFLALYKAYVGKSYMDRGDVKTAETSLKDAQDRLRVRGRVSLPRRHILRYGRYRQCHIRLAQDRHAVPRYRLHNLQEAREGLLRKGQV